MLPFRGQKAVPKEEVIVPSGQKGRVYYFVPAREARHLG